MKWWSFCVSICVGTQPDAQPWGAFQSSQGCSANTRYSLLSHPWYEHMNTFTHTCVHHSSMFHSGFDCPRLVHRNPTHPLTSSCSAATGRSGISLWDIRCFVEYIGWERYCVYVLCVYISKDVYSMYRGFDSVFYTSSVFFLLIWMLIVKSSTPRVDLQT